MNRGADAFRIYETALALEGEERASYLQQACADDDTLRGDVEKLLNAAEDAESAGFLDESPLDLLEDNDSDPDPGHRLGQRVGRYELIEVLGQGGFGTVYRARQHEPIDREVALKVIRGVFAGDDVIRRFEAERQVLASLQHPGIAQMLDAGTDRDGTPFMVMELVPGPSITRYCVEHQLGTEERLRLFIQVCEALGHAHQKGVIHRDLKPSNVLVVEQDGRPQPKIIDFGIALVVGDALDRETRMTREGLMGSPETMSPEQVAGSADLDTRTDIYGLGVLLYELLCGERPFTDEHGRVIEVLRKVAEDEPTRPSDVLRRSGAKHEGIAARPATLESDLDWIVLKAMDKDRERRYASAAALAEDVRRYLDDEPVIARPPGTLYLTGKFVRRHRLGVAAGLLLLLTLVGGIVGTSVGLLRAKQESDNARETVALLQEFLTAADPEERGRDLRVVELLEAFEPRLEALKNRPELAVELLTAYASTYRGLGLYESALGYARQARILRESLAGGNAPAALRAVNVETRLMLETDAAEAARLQASAARHQAETALGENDPVTLALAATMADAEHELGRFEAAETAYAAVLERQTEVLGPADEETLRTLRRRAQNLLHLSEYERAEAMSRESWARTRDAFGPEHPQTLRALGEVAFVLGESGRYEAAGEIHQDLLETRTRVLGSDHPKTLVSMGNLAWIRNNLGDHAGAVALYRKALEIQERVLGDGHRDTIATRANLATALMRTGELDEAERLMSRALEQRTALLGPTHPETLVAINDMLVVYARQQKFDQAAGMAEQLLAINREVRGDRHVATLVTLNNYAWLLMRLDRPEEALILIDEAISGRTELSGPDSIDTLSSRQTRVDVLLKLDRREEALDELESLVSASERSLGPDHRHTVSRRDRLANLSGAEATQ